jgi:DNA-directed RNA polymerase subunit RPC12/RpoP
MPLISSQRQKFEFRCTECQKYFDFVLNIELNGNYRIHCPNCGHVHYRVLKKGAITEDRFPQNDNQILIEDIRPMKASCRDYKTEKKTETGGRGYLNELWQRTVGELV